MTNFGEHAKEELRLLKKTVSNPIIAPFSKEIIALCDKVGRSGQSGGSLPYTAVAISQAIQKLLNFEVIAPLTGEDSEWRNVTMYGNGKEMKYQNIRDSRVFKQEDGRAYFIDAVVFDGDIGGKFTGNSINTIDGEFVHSRQFIKSFPFTPKTFYVDVVDIRWKDKEETIKDPDGDWWTHIIKDKKQLDAVYEYYDKE